MDRRYVFAWLLFAIYFAAFPCTENAQIGKPAGLPQQLSDRSVCSEEAGDTFSNARIARLSFVTHLRAEGDCDAPQLERRSFADHPPPASVGLAERDPIESELHQLGAAGYTIAVARQNVLAILRENNSCSAWYMQEEPDPSQKFASLRFQTDPNGEDSSIGEYDNFAVTFHQPYVARAQQDVGAGSIVTLNLHGAFFVSRAPIKLRFSPGGPRIPQTKELHVGSYVGGSLYAQITTLLHEYGHVVGLLPIDKGNAGSALLSTENTDTVVKHCRKQIEAGSNRAVVLPLSLAMFQQNGKHR